MTVRRQKSTSGRPDKHWRAIPIGLSLPSRIWPTIMISGPVFIARAAAVCECPVQTPVSHSPCLVEGISALIVVSADELCWVGCNLVRQMRAALVKSAWLTGNSGCCRCCCGKARSCRRIAGLRERTVPPMALVVFSHRERASALHYLSVHFMRLRIQRLLRTGKAGRDAERLLRRQGGGSACV